MESTQLHELSDSHLYGGSVYEFITDQISPSDTDILVAAPERQIASQAVKTIQKLKANQKQERNITTHTGDQTELPYATDSFDIAIHYNPTRGILQRHIPLYEITTVVKQGGSIIYRAPNYIAHSEAVTIDSLYVLDWNDHTTPSICGILSVEADGDLRSTEQATAPTETTITQFQNNA